MELSRCATAVFCLLTVAGCANQDLVVQRQTEMGARLDQLQQASAASGAKVADLGAEIERLREKLAAQAAELEQVKTAQRELQDNVSERFAPLAPAAKIEVVNRDPAREKEAGPPAEYLHAFGLYSANKYPAAIAAFESFLAANPASEYAGNALYWIGECYYSQSNLPKALDAFTSVVEKYPRGNKAPDALLKSGFTLYAMKEAGKAKADLETLIARYPKSPAAAKARERLAVPGK